jgi:hypothetical protein
LHHRSWEIWANEAIICSQAPGIYKLYSKTFHISLLVFHSRKELRERKGKWEEKPRGGVEGL